jgi:hypothetical protein
MMTNLETSKGKQKYLGECLIEAGLITPSQLETALKEQNSSDRHLQELSQNMAGSNCKLLSIFWKK